MRPNRAPPRAAAPGKGAERILARPGGVKLGRARPPRAHDGANASGTGGSSPSPRVVWRKSSESRLARPGEPPRIAAIRLERPPSGRPRPGRTREHRPYRVYSTGSVYGCVPSPCRFPHHRRTRSTFRGGLAARLEPVCGLVAGGRFVAGWSSPPACRRKPADLCRRRDPRSPPASRTRAGWSTAPRRMRTSRAGGRISWARSLRSGARAGAEDVGHSVHDGLCGGRVATQTPGRSIEPAERST